MQFPHFHQPRKDVGAILVTDQGELDDLIASGWPDKQCPPPGSEPVIQVDPDVEPETQFKRGPGRPRKES